MRSKEKSFIQKLRCGSPPDEDTPISLAGVLPGDVCKLLRAIDRDEIERTAAVLIHRTWKQEDGVPSTSLMWVRLITKREISMGTCLSYRCFTQFPM